MSEPKEKAMGYDYKRREWRDKNTGWGLPKEKWGEWFLFTKPQPGKARYLKDGYAEVVYDGMPYNMCKARINVPDHMCPDHLVDYECEMILESCPPQYPFRCPVKGCNKGKMVIGERTGLPPEDDYL